MVGAGSCSDLLAAGKKRGVVRRDASRITNLASADGHHTVDHPVPRICSPRAVLFTDIAGSARLYRRLGDAPAQRIVGAAIELLASTLPEYGGQVVKTIGDCMLCVFADPDGAALCARRMQRVLGESHPGGEAIRIHTGIDFGPVIEHSGDVFGDTVNVAAFLAAVASPDQILVTHRMATALSAAVKVGVRPLFNALLKGNLNSTAVYQVLWQPEDPLTTRINPKARRLLPSDLGSLHVLRGNRTLVVNRLHPVLAIGRGAGNDIDLTDMFVSHRHASIFLRHTNFYLEDQSVNGTFVRFRDGAEVHVLRGELLLEGAGRVSFGRSFDEMPTEAIDFFRDRRSMYRV
jgi:adenylate cyclase